MPTTMSPLRYPGGKTQFYDKITEIFSANGIGNDCVYLEAFAGGAGLAMKLLAKGKAGRAVLNDRDPSIYSFWNDALKHSKAFCEKIEKTPVTIEEWRRQRAIYAEGKPSFDLGFAAFFLNRTNRSGIITADPIGGLQQNGNFGIDCRFNKNALEKKVEFIGSMRGRISMSCMEACDFIQKNKGTENAFWFLDPPYYKKGRQLYRDYYSDSGHGMLADAILSSLDGSRWVLTYDVCDEVKYLYRGMPFVEAKVSYSVKTKRKTTELMYYNRLRVDE